MLYSKILLSIFQDQHALHSDQERENDTIRPRLVAKIQLVKIKLYKLIRGLYNMRTNCTYNFF